MTSHRIGSTRGFATLMAIILIGMVAVALTVMTALFTQQARRTRIVRTDAQLRQLLLAGGASVEERSLTWQADVAEQQWSVALPANPISDGAALSIHLAPTDRGAEATVEAKLGGRTARQTLSLTRTESKWQVSAARLVG